MTAEALVVVQARTGSTRLPGKVLADLGGRPMLALQLARLARLDASYHVVVATSDRPGDDAVADIAAGAGVDVVRGSEQDVLGRFALALERWRCDTVVRLTGDCPLSDPGIVADAVRLHRVERADYTSNVLPRSFPKGLDVEVVTAAALEAAHTEAVPGPDREHVTPFVYRRPERFRLANLDSGTSDGGEWWTVDTADDLADVRSIVDRLDDPVDATWHDVMRIVGRRRRASTRLDPAPTVAGSTPWVRRWTVVVDDVAVGSVDVAWADGTASRRFDVPHAHRAAAEGALVRTLDGDQQTRDEVGPAR